MAFLGGWFGAGPNNSESQANNLLNYNAQAATPISQDAVSSGKTALNTGMGFLNQFSRDAGTSGNYFQSLLSGNPANTTAALAPDINRIRDQNNQILQSTSMLSPRGGGRSSLLFNLPNKSASDVSGLFNSARPAAATNLANLAGEYGSTGLGAAGIGTNLFNTGVGALNAGTAAAGKYGELATNQQQFKYNAGVQAAQIIAAAIAGMPGLGGNVTGAAKNVSAFGGG